MAREEMKPISKATIRANQLKAADLASAERRKFLERALQGGAAVLLGVGGYQLLSGKSHERYDADFGELKRMLIKFPQDADGVRRVHLLLQGIFAARRKEIEALNSQTYRYTGADREVLEYAVGTILRSSQDIEGILRVLETRMPGMEKRKKGSTLESLLHNEAKSDPDFKELKRMLIKLPQDADGIRRIYVLLQGIFAAREKELDNLRSQSSEYSGVDLELLAYATGAVQYQKNELQAGLLRTLETRLSRIEVKKTLDKNPLS